MKMAAYRQPMFVRLLSVLRVKMHFVLGVVYAMGFVMLQCLTDVYTLHGEQFARPKTIFDSIALRERETARDSERHLPDIRLINIQRCDVAIFLLTNFNTMDSFIWLCVCVRARIFSQQFFRFVSIFGIINTHKPINKYASMMHNTADNKVHG